MDLRGPKIGSRWPSWSQDGANMAPRWPKMSQHRHPTWPHAQNHCACAANQSLQGGGQVSTTNHLGGRWGGYLYIGNRDKCLASTADICPVSTADIGISIHHSASAFSVNNHYIMEAAIAANFRQGFPAIASLGFDKIASRMRGGYRRA